MVSVICPAATLQYDFFGWWFRIKSVLFKGVEALGPIRWLAHTKCGMAQKCYFFTSCVFVRSRNSAEHCILVLLLIKYGLFMYLIKVRCDIPMGCFYSIAPRLYNPA